jgi:DNA-binding CsgD family transcriptional regulator
MPPRYSVPLLGEVDMDTERFGETVNAIYDAALSPERWLAALESLAKVFGCNTISVIERNLRTMEGHGFGIDFDEARQREYFEVWRHRNVLNKGVRYRTGGIMTDQEILPKSELLRSDYYNGFMKRHDMWSALIVSLQVENGMHRSLSLMRPRSAGEYEGPDVALARAFLPHLQRAALMTQHFNSARLMFQATTRMLEDHPTGIVLLERSGRIAFANRAARVMADRGDGFHLRTERMEALHCRDDDALLRLIAGATGRVCKVQAGLGGVLRLPRKSGLPDYVVVVAPLTDDPVPFGGPAPAAFILITDPEAAPSHPASLLRAIYGLTRTEARLAERLMCGDTPDQAAEAMSIKISTARAHLAELFRKTETERQAELIRLLLSLPWTDERMGQ